MIAALSPRTDRDASYLSRFVRISPIFVGIAIGIVAMLAACSESTAPGGRQIQAHLQRVSTGTGVSATLLASLTTSPPSGTPSAPHWSSAVNITSFKVPIFTIVLYSGGNNGPHATLYNCDAATNDGCLVELNGTALQDLVTTHPVTVSQGTYDHVSIQTCKSTSYTSYITATVSLNGATYYTKASGTLSTSSPAEALPLQYSGCGRNYSLPTPVVVTDSAGSTIPFTMYFDIRDIAWAATGGNDVQNAWLPGGCSGTHPDDAHPQSFMCTGYPDVAGIAGSTAPVLERYRINGSATIGLFFTTGTDLPIGGFTRRYFTEGDPTTPGFGADTPIDTLFKNSDGSLHLASFGGGSSNSSVLGPPYFATTAFKRQDHTGSFTAAGTPGTYSAVKLP